MDAKKEHTIGFEGKPIFRYNPQFSSIEGSYNKPGNHQFVVPWQMAKMKEKEASFK
ncbi:hypothetical protein [Maribellus maritimus]|uniref:hypothetical protein n=1 Tax=Maribellus maritimus TaxID=2870838 RepID=UPI001EEAA531|nr:hypothetical protein [Maribellus maritimus]MCG6186718.1 hypothetical protein [Maribellus maritimus]